MRITTSDYESWFLDFLEGNLDPLFADEFQAFLKQNPDLAKELEMWDSITLLTDKSIQFNAKKELKKTVDDQEIKFRELTVAYHEGDLSISEQVNFETWLSENPGRAAEAEKFGKLKLVPDNAILYPNKGQLKRSLAIVPLWAKVASVAAMLLLAYLLFHPGTAVRPESGQLADDMKNRDRTNLVVPKAKVKEEEKSEGARAPSVIPIQIPAKMPLRRNQHPAGQKSARKVIPSPDLRITEPKPSQLKPHGISFGIPGNIELAVMTLKDPAQDAQELELSELLKVQIAAMRNSDDREFLSTEHLGLSGLQLFAKLTGKRLTARKGEDGTVHSVSYNSRLIAFSIPVNR
jgi:hypothetical protein